MLLKTTSSLCPLCLAQVPARVLQRGEAVYLEKTCPDHGVFEALIASDARHYHLSLGRGEGEAAASSQAGACCAGGSCCAPAAIRQAPAGGVLMHDPGTVEHSSTCIALIEIVTSCNLECPTCFAGSEKKETVECLSFAEFTARIGSVLSRKPNIDILQLSGGEPTIHPEFFRILEWSLAHPRIGYCLLNTNGLKVAQEPAFAAQLGEIRRRLKKMELYLQFDGPQEAGQVMMRGLDLRKLRERALFVCAKEEIPATLAMTVDRHNQAHLGDTLRLALSNAHVRGITYQPMFGSGRAYAGVNVTVGGAEPLGPVTAATVRRPPVERLTVADIVKGVVAQSDGLLTEEDFTPLPCGDPNCHTVGYLLRHGGKLIGLSQVINLPDLQGFLKDRINFSLADLEKCGCENEELGRVLRALEIGPHSVLRLFVKPFMDAWTYDQHRIDRCCVHVVGEGGKLESFCRHYAMR